MPLPFFILTLILLIKFGQHNKPIRMKNILANNNAAAFISVTYAKKNKTQLHNIIINVCVESIYS